MLLCTKPVLTQTPSTPQGSPYLASHHGLFLAELRITNMSEKNAVWMARNMVLFFPILSLHLTTFLSFFFFLPSFSPIPIARCLASRVWHEILQIYIFGRAVTTGLNLTCHPWEHQVSFVCFRGQGGL